jgi:zinc/manganese transport system permease protein
MSDILFSAFLLSVVLLFIHSYFGLEIIRRGIIFTDLAIGQMAALGAAFSLFFLDGRLMYPVSLAFALTAGLLIAFVSRRGNHLEAFIGLMYAFGFTGVYILLSKSYHGMEEFQKLMAADILFTPLRDIIHTAYIYAGLGVVIWFFQRYTSGWMRDILFFVTFAVTVTSSVRLAGVLVVFALLVGPALIALAIGRGRLLFHAWAIGTVINVSAIALSYQFDFPTGYSIVFCNALLALVATALRRQGTDRPSRSRMEPGRPES